MTDIRFVNSGTKNQVQTGTKNNTKVRAGVTILFMDSFASGDFTHTQNGISWTGNTFVEVTSSFGRIDSKCARFRQGDSVSDTELRFDGLQNLKEVYLEYQMYWPIGTENPSLGPKSLCIGSLNDKFFRLWGGGDSGSGNSLGYNFGAGNATHPYASKVGASMYGSGSGPTYTDGKISAEFSYSDPTGQVAMGQVYGNGSAHDFNLGVAPQYVSTLVDANRGRWMRIRIHAKEATRLNNDGVLQIWFDNNLVLDYSSLANGNIYDGTGQLGYSTGYILGFANNNFPAGQYAYMDDFIISTGGFAG